MIKNPLFIFEDGTSKGLDKVPLNRLVFIEDSDGAGTPLLITIQDKTTVDSNTTITTFLALTAQYDIVGDYVHPTDDGNLHVPATNGITAGYILTTGGVAGDASWQVAPESYTGWTISDGTNSENIADTDTLTITGSGDTSVDYDTASNTVTVTSNETSYPADALVAQDITDISNLSGTNTGDETKTRIDALGIDAETLDDLDSSQFLRSDVSDSMAGTLTLTDGLRHNTTNGVVLDNIAIKNNGTIPDGYIKFVTPIEAQHNQMFSIDIVGYDYNRGESIDFTVVGYAYSSTNNVIQYGFSNRSSFYREVRIALEDRGGANRVMVIALGAEDSAGVSTQSWYYQKFSATVRMWAGQSTNHDVGDFVWVNGETTLAVGYWETVNINNLWMSGETGTITVNGSIIVGGTVDGVDIASDHTRLENTSGTNTGDQVSSDFSLEGLSDTLDGMTPTLGQVLTYNADNVWVASDSEAGGTGMTTYIQDTEPVSWESGDIWISGPN